jgi:regulator of replication initiation timing
MKKDHVDNGAQDMIANYNNYAKTTFALKVGDLLAKIEQLHEENEKLRLENAKLRNPIINLIGGIGC